MFVWIRLQWHLCPFIICYLASSPTLKSPLLVLFSMLLKKSAKLLGRVFCKRCDKLPILAAADLCVFACGGWWYRCRVCIQVLVGVHSWQFYTVDLFLASYFSYFPPLLKILYDTLRCMLYIIYLITHYTSHILCIIEYRIHNDNTFQ